MKMPKLSGIDVLKYVKEIKNETGVIILTGHGDIDNAIDAMKDGAFDYLNKPVNADKLVISIQNAIAKKKLTEENQKLTQDLITKNEYLQGLHDSAQKILLNLVPKNIPTFENIKITSN